jgi:hypothetical protein
VEIAPAASGRAVISVEEEGDHATEKAAARAALDLQLRS